MGILTEFYDLAVKIVWRYIYTRIEQRRDDSNGYRPH